MLQQAMPNGMSQGRKIDKLQLRKNVYRNTIITGKVRDKVVNTIAVTASTYGAHICGAIGVKKLYALRANLARKTVEKALLKNSCNQKRDI